MANSTSTNRCNYPASLDILAKQVLHDNLDKNEDLVLQIDHAVLNTQKEGRRNPHGLLQDQGYNYWMGQMNGCICMGPTAFAMLTSINGSGFSNNAADGSVLA